MMFRDVFRIFTYAFIFLVSFMALVHAARFSFILTNYWYPVYEMLDGWCSKPYIYRTLLPTLANWLEKPMPAGFHYWFGYYTREFGQWIDLHPSEKFSRGVYSARVGMVLLMMYGSLLLYAFSVIRISRHFFPERFYLPYATGMLSLVLILHFINPNTKLYDFPVLGLNALALLLMFTQRFGWYCAALVIASINKETAIFLIFVFLMIYWDQLPRKTLIFWLALQAALSGTTIFLIRLRYANNFGDDLLYNPFTILSKALIPYDTFDITALLALFYFIFAFWRELPLILRRSLWIVVPMLISYMLFGIHREYRVFLDVMPVVAVIIGYTLFSRLEPMPARQRS